MHGLFTIGNDTPHVNGYLCATLVNDIAKSHSSFYEIIAINIYQARVNWQNLPLVREFTKVMLDLKYLSCSGRNLASHTV